MTDHSIFPRLMRISTGHLSARTAKFLQQNDVADWPFLGGHWGTYGWILWVHTEETLPNFPCDLKEAFEFASSEGAEMLMFDEAGQTFDALRIYGSDGDHDADEFLYRPSKPFDQL